MKTNLSTWLIPLSVMLGVLVGLGGYTFVYAKGYSYMSNDPTVCINCHIMRDEYDGWNRAPHHAVATCVDCHLPHDLAGKYMAKGLNGFNHSKAFTLQNFHEPIIITPHNARILQDNCVRCHKQLTENILKAEHGEKDTTQCVRCHSRVGHNP